VVLAIAQRASLPIKIEACARTGVAYYGRCLAGDNSGGVQTSLRDCLADAHQDIITCWNFRDEEKILSSERFKQLMLCLVQDIQESQNHGESNAVSTPGVDKISQFLSPITTTSPSTAPPLEITGALADWLKDAVLPNVPQVRRLLMTYTVDLTTVLKSLFDISLNRMPQSPARTTWLELKEAFEAYNRAGSHKQIHGRIRVIFQQDQQNLDSDRFQRVFRELVKDEGPKWGRRRTKGLSAQDASVHTSQPSAPSTSTAQPSALPPSTPLPSAPRPRRRGIRIPCLCP